MLKTIEYPEIKIRNRQRILSFLPIPCRTCGISCEVIADIGFRGTETVRRSEYECTKVDWSEA